MRRTRSSDDKARRNRPVCAGLDWCATLGGTVSARRRLYFSLSLAIALSWPAGPSGARATTPHPAADGLTVLSLNLALGEDVDRIASRVRAIGGEAADVMLLQEVIERPGQPSVAHELAERFGLEAVFRREFTLEDGRGVGLATLGRFPAIDARVFPLKHFDLAFRSRDRTALAVTLDTPAGPLRTYNVHLDTRINSGDRLDQIAPVIDDVTAAPGGAIVAGDFNTNGNLWLFHTIPLPFLGRQGRGLEQFMARHGLQSVFDGGPTHDALRMRLDWVFLKDLHASSRSIHPVDVSDHHALIVSVDGMRR